VRFVRVGLIVLVAAASASAQETQQDVADRIVREQTELRTRSVDQALAAPTRAMDRVETRKPAVLPDVSKAFPWGWVGVGFVALLVVLRLFSAAWRRAGEPRR
jgi:hypothetical protein